MTLFNGPGSIRFVLKEFGAGILALGSCFFGGMFAFGLWG